MRNTRHAIVGLCVALTVLGGPLPVLAQEPVVPGDSCYAIVHGYSSSTLIVYLTFPPEWEDSLVHIESDGPSGSQSGESAIDMSGLSETSLALYSYGTHTITNATVTIAGVEFPVDMSGLGDGGTYVVDDNEPVCDPSDLALVAPTTTTVATTTTTTEPTTTTTVQETTTTTTSQQTTSTSGHTSTTVPSNEGDSTGFPWPAFAIGFGLLFLLGGIFLARQEEVDPCEPLRRAWQADEDRWRKAKEGLAEFRADLENRRRRVKELEAELAMLETAADSSIVVDGQTRHLIDGGFIGPDQLATQTSMVRNNLETARTFAADAEQTVKDWEQRVANERTKADASKAAYEECIGGSLPGVSDGGDTDGGDTTDGTGGGGVDVATGGGGTVVDGGPSVATPPDEPPEEEEGECEEPHEEARPGGAAEKDTFVVDFSVIIEVQEGSEKKVQEAEDMAFGLNDVGNILDAAGNLLTGTGALKSVVSGLGAMKAGKYVMGTKGLAEGAAGGAMFADVVPSVPTNPAEAMVEFFEQTAKLGGLVAEKAGEWLTMNQLYQARVTYFQQTITAKPFEKWVCEDKKMVCKAKFWEYTVGPLSRRAGPKSRVFRLDSDIAKTQWNRELRTLAGVAQREIEKSVQKRVQFDADHHPSACDS